MGYGVAFWKDVASWIVELMAILNNKGKVQHKIETFGFELSAIYSDEPIEVSESWQGQVDFPHLIEKRSYVPKGPRRYFFIGPSVTARYSYVARVPRDATFLILHCTFVYFDRPGSSHPMEKTVRVPTTVECDNGRASNSPTT